MYKLYFGIRPAKLHSEKRHEVYQTEIDGSSAEYIAEESSMLVRMSDDASIRVYFNGIVEVCILAQNAIVGFDGRVTVADGDPAAIAETAIDAYRVWDYVKLSI